MKRVKPAGRGRKGGRRARERAGALSVCRGALKRSKRLVLSCAALAGVAVGVSGGWVVVRGLPQALLYPPAALLLFYLGVVHGLEGTLAPLALVPLIAGVLYFIVGVGFALTGGWTLVYGDAVSLALASVSLALVYASAYASGFLALRGRLQWVEEGLERGEAGERAVEGKVAAGRFPFRVPRLRVKLPWLRARALKRARKSPL